MQPEYVLPLRLRDMAMHERPQERLERLGAAALADAELLAMLLRSGSKGLDVLAVSQRMISQGGSLAGLLRWSEQDFRKIKGVGRVKALQLLTVMEVARRVLSQEGGVEPLLDTPQRVYEQLYPHAAGLEVEKFWVLCLNRKNRLIKQVEVSSGTVSNSLVHPREVFREAIRQASAAVICAHNHPSGDPSPSGPDKGVTAELAAAAKLLGIELLDHLIVGLPQADPRGRGWFSFRDAGLL
jgi:DNA repair protein RadC